jgi:hypothetical protein
MVKGSVMTTDWYRLASHWGQELDEMLDFQDFDCALCGLRKGNHAGTCPVAALLDYRRQMRGLVIQPEGG